MLTSFDEPTAGFRVSCNGKNCYNHLFYQECEVQLAQMDEQRRLLENNLKRSAYRLTKRTRKKFPDQNLGLSPNPHNYQKNDAIIPLVGFWT